MIETQNRGNEMRNLYMLTRTVGQFQAELFFREADSREEIETYIEDWQSEAEGTWTISLERGEE